MKRVLVRGVRFSPDEWEKIRQLAQACGMPPTTYLRTVGLGTVPAPERRLSPAPLPPCPHRKQPQPAREARQLRPPRSPRQGPPAPGRHPGGDPQGL